MPKNTLRNALLAASILGLGLVPLLEAAQESVPMQGPGEPGAAAGALVTSSAPTATQTAQPAGAPAPSPAEAAASAMPETSSVDPGPVGPAAAAMPQAPEAPVAAPSEVPRGPAAQAGQQPAQAEPADMPSRESMERLLEERRQAIEARLRAMDPWGQYRREWRDAHRQRRRDELETYRASPGFGGYPWGPVAPYYGSPWGEPVAPRAPMAPLAPTPPTREGLGEYFERQHRAIDEQWQRRAPWTPPVGSAYRQRGDWAREEQARRLRENPWAPSTPAIGD